MNVGDFIPAFYIESSKMIDGETGELITETNYNNATVFDYYYSLSDDSLDSEDFEQFSAISCIDYINGPHWDGISDAKK